MGDGLDRARADIDAGRLWKARDRLRGVVGSLPADQEALRLLGEVHLRMGDDPEAGRWLFLTERDDDAARAAVAAFTDRFAFDQLLRQVPAYAPIEDYPPSGLRGHSSHRYPSGSSKKRLTRSPKSAPLQARRGACQQPLADAHVRR